jgi:predicted 3-demethylubiquinone-9 3-methyltransferase (glyoxalase superfamily)
MTKEDTMQRITPCLWFNDNAEKAVKFYTSIFRNSKITTVPHYGEAGSRASGRPVGTVMTIAFKLENQDFLALNGGPHFTFSPAISLVANCKTQREIDDLWSKLGAGGRIDPSAAGSRTFGVSWQIVPADIGKLVQGSRDGKADRVMQAIHGMKKIDVATLKRAAR